MIPGGETTVVSTQTLQLHHGNTERTEGYGLDFPRDRQDTFRRLHWPFQAGGDCPIPLNVGLCALCVSVVKNPG